MKHWHNALASRGYSFFIGILFLNMVSGLTFTLVSFTLPYQLSEAGYSTQIIGSIFLATIPYCCKPLWAPFIDKYSIPILCNKFGHRRGWILLIQILLTLSISGFLMIENTKDLRITSIILLIISFLAATQDIILDAYRIEQSNTKDQLVISATCSSIGFRFGILLSSVGALYLSHIFNWYVVYSSAIILTTLGPIIILYIKEVPIKINQETTNSMLSLKQYFDVLQDSIMSLKQSQPHWKLIMLFIFLYKASDTIPAAMSSPFFIDLSFSAMEIATISKAYGLSMLIIGTVIGGWVVLKLGIFKGIIICGSIQLFSPVMFMLLALTGHNVQMFIIVITLQNLCCGLGGAALSIYYSTLCNGKFVATQFALIASFSSLVRITLSFLSGLVAHYFEWSQFFLGNVLLSMLFLLVHLRINSKKVLKPITNS